MARPAPPTARPSNGASKRSAVTDSSDGPTRRYLVGDAFAHGGVGAVHDAHDRALHRELAYKVLLPERTDGEQYRARFVREARLTAQLQHPNIVPVHDLGVDGEGNLFFTMQRVHGRTLERILRTVATDASLADQFPLPRLLVMFGQMCQAVHYAHTRGVLHRDLKPANVMIGALGQVLVMDWGLAKRIPALISAQSSLFEAVAIDAGEPPSAADLQALADDDTGRLKALLDEPLPEGDDLVATIPAPFHGGEPSGSQRLDQLDSDRFGSSDAPGVDLLGAEGETAGVYETQDGRVLGTPPYMAPEQARGRTLDVRSDVYALGAILYEILALRPAFRGGRALRVMTAVARGEFEPPSHWALTSRPVAPTLERICLRAMALAPDSRYPTAWALFLAIESFLQGTEERRRREAAAEAALGDARQQRARWTRTRHDLQRAHAAWTRLQSDARPSDSLASKRAVWAAEDHRDRVALEVERQHAALEQSLHAALRQLPDHAPARRALAEHAWDALQEAELRNDQPAQIRYEEELRAIDDGTWTPMLGAPSLLLVDVDPGEADVRLAPLVDTDRRLVAGPARPLVCPASETLAPGRYVLTAAAPGRAPVTLPFKISRGGRLQLTVRLHPSASVPEGFVAIPGGEAWIGGDPEAQRGLTSLRVRIPDFAIATRPVTMREYLEFLADLESQSPGAGWVRAPRNEPEGGQMLVRTEDGALALPTVDDGGHQWDPELPVMAVSFDDAVAFAEWRTARDGRRFRLPTEAEWEYAARSTDGRIFPWGDRFVGGYALVLGTLDDAQPQPVGYCEADINGFGVLDLAGGSRDWCDGWKTARKQMRVQRGGAWWDRPERSRLASRSGWPPTNVFGDSGFRLVVSLPSEPAGPGVLDDPDDPRYGGVTDEHLPPV